MLRPNQSKFKLKSASILLVWLLIISFPHFLFPFSSIQGNYPISLFSSLFITFFSPSWMTTPAALFAYPCLSFAESKVSFSNQEKLKGSLSISGAWALYPLVVRWAEEFRKKQPGVRIDVQAGGAGKGVTDVLSGAAHIAMVSRDLHPEEKRRGAIALAVAKDAVVLTISEKNPYLKALLIRGITREELIEIWISGKIKFWGDLFQKPGKEPINLYTRSDACGAGETWAAFLGAKQEDLRGTGVYGDPGVAEAVKRDPFGLGYNNLNFAFDPTTGLPVKGLIVLPLDLNNNNQVDSEESFTANRQSLIIAIQEGRYPSPPSRDLYLVLRNEPQPVFVLSFLAYVLGDGQKIIPEAGYVEVSIQALQESKDLLGKIKVR
ncbi:MAG: substrate-binding domain-containing protein [Candidatus Aminicenantes bacterium]|nr:substrate-binding domain-containing protein [Candidatus Aminicenantes bacterium]